MKKIHIHIADVQPLISQFPNLDFAPDSLIYWNGQPSGQTCVRVPPERLIEVLLFLKYDVRYEMEQLSDLTCVDYLNFSRARDRFGVTYSLLSISLNHRLWVKCFVNDPNTEVPSVTGLWPGADWLEREVYDMFGIRFKGHPDLRRILTWEEFDAHPLRKDYPLRGRGERENFEAINREST